MDLLKRYNQSCGVSEAASEAVRGIPYISPHQNQRNPRVLPWCFGCKMEVMLTPVYHTCRYGKQNRQLMQFNDHQNSPQHGTVILRKHLLSQQNHKTLHSNETTKPKVDRRTKILLLSHHRRIQCDKDRHSFFHNTRAIRNKCQIDEESM